MNNNDQNIDKMMDDISAAINQAAEETVKKIKPGSLTEPRNATTSPALQTLNCQLAQHEKDYSALLKLLPVSDTHLQKHEATKNKIREKCSEIKILRNKWTELIAQQTMGRNKLIRKTIASRGGRSSKLFWTLAKSAESVQSLNSLKRKDGTQTSTPEETLARAQSHFDDLLKQPPHDTIDPTKTKVKQTINPLHTRYKKPH
jgi:hypothetical protein